MPTNFKNGPCTRTLKTLFPRLNPEFCALQGPERSLVPEVPGWQERPRHAWAATQPSGMISAAGGFAQTAPDGRLPIEPNGLASLVSAEEGMSRGELPHPQRHTPCRA